MFIYLHSFLCNIYIYTYVYIYIDHVFVHILVLSIHTYKYSSTFVYRHICISTCRVLNNITQLIVAKPDIASKHHIAQIFPGLSWVTI